MKKRLWHASCDRVHEIKTSSHPDYAEDGWKKYRSLFLMRSEFMAGSRSHGPLSIVIVVSDGQDGSIRGFAGVDLEQIGYTIVVVILGKAQADLGSTQQVD